jgi:thiosulfate reductase cytochrome b subunit
MSDSTVLPAESAPAPATNRKRPPPVFPLWLRITHWLNALGVVVMVMSGWQIYNASPLFPFRFSASITLGGWLGGGIQWHFAAMWIIVVNGLFYLIANLVSRRFFSQFFPLSPRTIARDLVDAVRGRLSHDDLRVYNAVQRAAYLFAMLDLIVLVLSGLVLWKSVQFGWLRDVLGGYDFARRIHFFAMSGIVAFVAVHVVMAVLVPRTILAMIRGR